MKYLKDKKYALLVGLVVAIITTLGVVFFVNGDVISKDDAKVAGKGEKLKKTSKRGRLVSLKGRRIRGRVSSPNGIAVSSGRVALDVKPSLDYDDEEASLSEEYRKLLSEIRKALDGDDKRALLRLVQKVQSNRNWVSDVPFLVKSAMLDALGWFGAACLPEITGFMSDSNEEIAQSAVEKYEEALSDSELSDRERSKLLVLASQVITDSDAMESMLFELNNMRNSVAVETIKQLMASGGDATQSLLPESIEFFTGEEGLNTPEKLDEWLTANPDDETDEEFYGRASSDE